LTLTSGTLQFGSASALADTFQGFLAGDTFKINGGIIDNISGSPGKTALGAGGYSIGGNFTFAGSSSLDFGTEAVTNKGNYTITMTNTLAILSFEATPNFDTNAPAATIIVNSGGFVGEYRETVGSFRRGIVLNGGGTMNLSGSGQIAYLDAPILLAPIPR